METPQEIAEMLTESRKARVGQLGGALGLDPQFVSQVQTGGMGAVQARAEMIDQTGAHGRVLLMAEQFGIFIQEQIERGAAPIKPAELLQAAQMISQAHGVNPEIGVHLLGTVLEVYQDAADRLAQDTYKGNDNEMAGKQADGSD